jgi:thermostable 8-oxoguanine DNA glycosylase
VALWKINRVLDVPESVLTALGALARRRTRIDRRSRRVTDLIEALVRCSGIHYPMASAILKFLRPDVFPIIDVRAYRALTGRKLSRKTYSLQRYLDYADELERLAARLERPLSEMDEQLYEFDQDKNGRI